MGVYALYYLRVNDDIKLVNIYYIKAWLISSYVHRYKIRKKNDQEIIISNEEIGVQLVFYGGTCGFLQNIKEAVNPILNYNSINDKGY